MARHLVTGPVSIQNHVEHGSLALDVLNQAAVLPPVMCAPPSSPVAFCGNTESASSHPSTATLLTLFPAKSGRLSSQSALQIDAISTNAAVGSFMLDNALVTPPIYSTLTTAPTTPLSTAPFTPPPELAHLTTPSSPEIPFAQLLASSLECSLSEQAREHPNLGSFPPTSFELIYQLYPCSPIGQLVSSRSGASSSETLSPLPERVYLENNATAVEVVNDSTVSAIESAPFRGFGMATSESICHKPIIDGVLPHSTICLQEVPHVKSHSTDAPGVEKRDATAFIPNKSCANDSCGYKYWHKTQDSRACCSRCGELSAKCRDLSEALEQTKEKLILIERRVDSIDDREKKFKQLIQWMQLGAKLQQENIFQLSKELSWQEKAFFDLQECHLAESGINISTAGGDL